MKPVSSQEFHEFQRRLGTLRTGITDDRSQRYETDDNRLSFFQTMAGDSEEHEAFIAWILLSKHMASLHKMVMKMRRGEALQAPPGEHILSTVADVMNYVEFIGKMIEDTYAEQETPPPADIFRSYIQSDIHPDIPDDLDIRHIAKILRYVGSGQTPQTSLMAIYEAHSSNPGEPATSQVLDWAMNRGLLFKHGGEPGIIRSVELTDRGKKFLDSYAGRYL